MNQLYSIDCTGDAVVGDEVRFERAVFTGSFRKPKFAGMETLEATIVADSYGADKQQHTFTLKLANGSTLRIKGRNLYREGTWRKPWPVEAERSARAQEKHERGDAARTLRTMRMA